MSNKENYHYRPHYYAVKDKKSDNILWMIPISSKTEKYKKIIENKIKRYGKCNTIVIGIFAGKENAFLIQNAFPITKDFLDHVHKIEGKPIQVHKKLHKLLVKNLHEILAMKKQGINLLFADVDRITDILLK